MIINTGLRTDIPAFYADWFCRRLLEGFVMARNPYSPSEVTRYRLDPGVVDIMVFCTKNPSPMLPRLDLLEPYNQYWFVTVTPYGREIEPNVPPKEKALDAVRALSGAVGANMVAWRYDPVFIGEDYTAESHVKEFRRMAEYLKGFVHTAVISFIDLYRKTRRSFPEGREVEKEQQERLARKFSEIGAECGMTVKSCAEDPALSRCGLNTDGCMTIRAFCEAFGFDLKAPRRRPGRKGCACELSADIGQYDTCPHLCRYCYANTNAALVAKNHRLHDPGSPLLIGNLRPGDTVRDAKQESWRVPGPSLNL